MKAPTKKAILKRRGRPAIGKAPSRTFRLSDEFMATLDTWAGCQPDRPTRSEAIRRLVEIGLATGPKALPSQRLRSMRADRAKELAAKTIEKIIDPAAPTVQRIARRRRLTRGPAEFRDARLDQPKSKS